MVIGCPGQHKHGVLEPSVVSILGSNWLTAPLLHVFGAHPTIRPEDRIDRMDRMDDMDTPGSDQGSPGRLEQP
jgi:hypothetical protein